MLIKIQFNFLIQIQEKFKILFHANKYSLFFSVNEINLVLFSLHICRVPEILFKGA